MRRPHHACRVQWHVRKAQVVPGRLVIWGWSSTTRWNRGMAAWGFPLLSAAVAASSSSSGRAPAWDLGRAGDGILDNEQRLPGVGLHGVREGEIVAGALGAEAAAF